MISIDASEIASWAARPEASNTLPDLVRRLIIATVPKVSLLDMPSGSSVHLPGWDGLLIVEHGNPWVPDGVSGWEFSRQSDFRAKATADYGKRTENPRGIETSNAAFMFVTPRVWTGTPDKHEWAHHRVQKDSWANVRALDANDLVLWLEQAPAVARWLARLMGKPTFGVMPLNEWWERWNAAANPEISHELVVAGRHEQAQMIADWFQNEPSQYYVQGTTRDEAIAFLAACAGAETTLWGSALLERALVVGTADTMASLEGHPSPLVLVRSFSDADFSSRNAVRSGHHVLIPLSETDDPRGYGLTLPRLGRDETKAALVAMGLTEHEARLLCRNTARRLPAIRRQLVDEAGGAGPDWASSGTPRSIVTLVMIGQWDADSEGDKGGRFRDHGANL